MAKGALRWADVKTAWGRQDDAWMRVESAEQPGNTGRQEPGGTDWDASGKDEEE